MFKRVLCAVGLLVSQACWAGLVLLPGEVLPVRLDAPAVGRTTSEAQQHPMPLLLQVDAAWRPGLDCLLIAEAYGDLHQARLMVSLSELSCRRPDGSAFEVPVTGVVVGMDARNGVPGMLAVPTPVAGASLAPEDLAPYVEAPAGLAGEAYLLSTLTLP